jgi:alkylhydroperoxidase/carboxymuconolactone decarboxylase family protein YurZ
MLMRAAVFFLLLGAGVQQSAADPVYAEASRLASQDGNAVAGWKSATADIAPVIELPLLKPGAGEPGDIFGGQGPSTHSRELAGIATAAAYGDRDRVEIISRQIRKFGATQEEIQDAIYSAKLHTDAPALSPASLPRPASAPGGTAW